MDTKSIEKGLRAVTEWHTAFEAEAIRAAGEEQLSALQAENAALRKVANAAKAWRHLGVYYINDEDDMNLVRAVDELEATK